ncbi:MULTISPECIES: ABC transporter permease [Nocardiopsis]|jgi:NitT/TauT family transport system permease protein|uniref:ABC transporter permease n=1 Tax=Nocardiopsis sinuspersici TaxID=501010 RepID=A0A1V3C9S7_9ACTN|nr:MULTISPECIES: ABC transporter permease [Nocardiopsis]NYH53075.1 NitT/TauT family transport system permease protein [Nocardiopsis sinuspersici]OOC57402.1 ABC transporter permease [Nocardiopsis sinuspersici]
MATSTPVRSRSGDDAPVRRRGTRARGSALSPGVWLPTAVAVVLVGFAWSAIAADQPYLLPPLSEVGAILVEDPLLFLTNAWSTLSIALLGVACGAGTAFVLALLMSEVPVLRRAIMPLAVVLNVTPVVALAPALVVAFGFGMAPKVIVTAIITFFPVLINVTTGLRSVSVPVLHVFSTLHASRMEVLLRLRVPSSLPYTLAALRVVFPLSIVGAVVAEFVAAGSSSGLGTMIRNSAATARLEYVYAAVACLATMGVLMLALITLLERRLLFWHESQQRTTS